MTACFEIHKKVASLKKYKFSELTTIGHKNGLYVFFEEGETYQNLDRIVRVGNHPNKQDNLIKRIEQHFKSNRYGSVFVKLVGQALIGKDNKPELLCYWSQSQGNRVRINNLDVECLVYENRAKQYIKNMKFSIIPIEDMELRNRAEKAIIASLCADISFSPSPNWLGYFMPEKSKPIKVNSRMWLSDFTEEDCITDEEIKRFFGE